MLKYTKTLKEILPFISQVTKNANMVRYKVQQTGIKFLNTVMWSHLVV